MIIRLCSMSDSQGEVTLIDWSKVIINIDKNSS